MIPTKQLSSGAIPLLGLGTWKLTGDKCTIAVADALEMGYTHIDTAMIYGNESEVGKAINHLPREDLWITSKVWKDDLSYEGILAACNNSLNKLQTNYLDLYLIHWPSRGEDMQPIFKAFKELLDQGKIKAMGVSNFNVRDLQEVLPIAKEQGVPIVTNQVEFHPGLFQKELLHFCHDNQIALTAYSPLGRAQLLDNPLIVEIANLHNKTPAQVCLKWIIQKDIIAIPKASSKEHLDENMNVFDFMLSTHEMEQLDELGNTQRTVSPDWHDFSY